MGIQIIHYENDLFSVRIINREELFNLICPVNTSSMFMSVCGSPPFQWFSEQKNTAGTFADIFGILPLRFSLLHRNTATAISQ